MTTEPCTWYQDGLDSDIWTPDCGGGSFQINDGSPHQNNMRFCCRCGRPLQEQPHQEDKP